MLTQQSKTTLLSTSFLAMILVMFFMAWPANAVQSGPMTSTPVDDSTSETHQMDEIDLLLQEYIDSESLTFDVARAQNEGRSHEEVQIGKDYNSALEYVYVTCLAGEEKVQASGFEESVNGTFALGGLDERWNWCGEKRTDGGAPVNTADQVCKSHDLCLRTDRAICDCDKTFVRGMKAIKGNYSGMDRLYIEAAIRAVPAYHKCNF